MELADRRRAVMSVLDDAAHSAGIPRDLLGGIWGKESSYGKSLTSPTGCEGDFQFLSSTWVNMIRDDGAKIAARLRATGHADEAAAVENYQKGLRNHTIRRDDAGLLALRDDPYISTYAAAYLIKDTARAVHADPHNKAQWGDIYAGYNVGPTAARQLRGKLADVENCKEHLGVAAKANPAFFVNRATGTEALQRYQNSMEHYADNFTSAAEHGFASSPRKSNAARRQETVATPVVPPATSAPAARQPAGTQPDYFEDIVGKYLGDGQVHRYKDTIVKYGICQSANPDIDVAHLTRDQALQVYRDRYWNNLKGIHEMSREEAAAAFRMSYRHGADYANRHLAAAETKTESTAPQSLRSTFQTQSAPPQPESLVTTFLRSAASGIRSFFTLSPGMPAPTYM